MGYMIWYCYHRIIPCLVWRLGPLMNIIIVIIPSLFVYDIVWYGRYHHHHHNISASLKCDRPALPSIFGRWNHPSLDGD